MKRTAGLLAVLVTGILSAGSCDWKAPIRGTGDTLKRTGQGMKSAVSKANPASWGGSEERLVDEYDFVIEVGGKRRTTGHVKRSSTEYNGVQAVLTETKQKSRAIRSGQEFDSTVARRVYTGPRQEALFSEEISNDGGQQSVQRITVEGATASFESYGTGERTTKEAVPVPPGVIFSIDAPWLAQQPLETGKSFTANVLNRRQKRVLRETAQVLEQKPVVFRGETIRAWAVRIDSEDAPGNPVTMTFTPDGRIIRMDLKGVACRVVENAEAETAAAPAYEVVTTVPLDFPLPAWDGYDTVALEPLPAVSWDEHLAENEYMALEKRDGRLIVTLRKTAPKVPASLAFPVPPAPAELQPYLQRAGSITPDDPAVREKARQLTATRTDALDAVAVLAGWVHYTIKWSAKGRMNTSPAETMANLRGDCSEHADLFASLARAVGIPTRHCAGLLVQRESAIYHGWVEVHLGGAWVPIDTTVNRVGLPAGYLLTARDGTGAHELRDTFPVAMAQGNLGLRVIEMTRDRRRIVPGETASYVAFDGNWLANLYHGFALQKPQAWSGKLKLKAIEVRSPDESAWAVCDILEAAYRVSADELENLAVSLERRMNQFRLVKKEIVALRGAEALLIDYSFVQDGAALRCRQYIVPRRGRSYRLACYAPMDSFTSQTVSFDAILNSLEF